MAELYLLCMLPILGLVHSDGDIRLPPTITRENTVLEQYLQENTEVTLPCEADGVPPPEYEWKFNGADLGLNDPNIRREGDKGTIVVTVDALHEGNYQCFAKNQYGVTMTDISILHRAVLAGFPVQSEDHVYPVQQGNHLILNCEQTKSIPPPTFSWQIVSTREDKEPQTVITDKRIQLDDNGNLYFANVMKSDEQGDKIYKCVTTNPNSGGSKFGSYSKIRVSEIGNNQTTPPANLFHTGVDSRVVAIKGRDVQLKCIFSGNEAPSYSWSKINGALPNGRHVLEQQNTMLTIKNVQESDGGTYVCTGTNSAGSGQSQMLVQVKSVPTFTSESNQPMNANVTQGENAIFKCNPDSDPVASIQWYLNGEPLSTSSPPPRWSFEESDRKLTIQEVCKECPNPPPQSDLRVIQCNASNEHGYAFSAGYINVLVPTTLSKRPKDYNLVYREDVVFECDGASDDSTPLTISWYLNGQPVVYTPDVIFKDNERGSVLRIVTAKLPKAGLEYVGNFTCVIDNGYSQVKETVMLIPPENEKPPALPIGSAMADWWWVILLVCIILAILFIVLCCWLCRRDPQDEYNVDEKERANGNDPEKELQATGFHGYQRVPGEAVQGSRASLASTGVILEVEDEDGSLADYVPGMRKYSEDGSFLGQYNTGTKKRDNEIRM